MKNVIWLLLLASLTVFTAGCGVIEDGQAGVKIDLGNISDQPLSAGFYFFMPIVTRVENWNVKTQEIKETARVPSSEGLVATLHVSLLYHVSAANVVSVRKSVGFDYRNVIIIPYLREAIRNVVSGYEIKALYSEAGRTEIAIKLEDLLQNKLAPRGVEVEQLLLRDIQLPKVFSASIELKLKTEQEALQKQFELEKAKKDAEIEVARAEGVAKANEIIAGSITEAYLRYRFIEGLNDGNTEVIYVPTEANLPILEARDNR